LFLRLVDLGIDSLTAEDFAAELQKDFQLCIRSEEVKEMTLNDLI
jgi:acyl carrier protein